MTLSTWIRRPLEPLLAVVGLAAGILVAWDIPGYGSGLTHTPPGILFQGFATGAAGALAAVGIVLIYRSLRIINFAQLALGVAGAALAFNFIYFLGAVPFPLVMLIGILVGVGLGAVFQLVFGLRFGRAPRLVLTLATIFAAPVLSGVLSGLGVALPFFPPVNQRSLEQLTGALSLRPQLPFQGFHFHVGTFGVPFGFPEVLTITASLAAVIALAAFLRFTQPGRAIRAMAENSERAALLGISVTGLAFMVWMIAGGLSALQAMLLGFQYTPGLVLNPGIDTLLIPLSAAVLARMRSLLVATCAAIALTTISSAVDFQAADYRPLFDLGLLLALGAGILLRGRALDRTSVEASSWQATTEVRPVPREMSRLPLVRISKYGAAVILVLAAIGFPFVVPIGDTQIVSTVFLTALVAISVVMLTGWAGQASFGQFGLAAVGALTAGALASKLGVSFWLAVPVATLITAGVGLLLAFPALRIRGLFLVPVTFAFAIVAADLLFSTKFFPWLQPGQIRRPQLFLIDFEDTNAMYFLCFAALVAGVVVARNLRRSRFGRLVIATRENEADVQSHGVGVLRTKLAVFAVSAAMAGFAGALLAFDQQNVNVSSFGPDQSLVIFEMVIVGGAASISGGLLGVGVLFGLSQVAPLVSGLDQFLPIVPLLVLYFAPGGLLGALASGRDAVLRIVAQRSQMIVPSLFTDIDPEALRLQLIPLAANVQGPAPSAFRIVGSFWSRLGVTGSQAAPEATLLAAVGQDVALEGGEA